MPLLLAVLWFGSRLGDVRGGGGDDVVVAVAFVVFVLFCLSAQLLGSSHVFAQLRASVPSHTLSN